MTASTSAVIMASAARLGPWGDDSWRFAGAMQLVSDGPDWLHAHWPLPDEEERQGGARFATMTLRDAPAQRAADIAVMAFALLRVEEWRLLHPWWDDATDRTTVDHVLDRVANQYTGQFKLAVVQTETSGVAAEVMDELRLLGFEVVAFTA
jgi:hypothetical protein